MDVMTLEVQPRDKSKKVKALLRENIVPIEYYGKGIENKSFQVDYQTFRRLYKEAGVNTIVELTDGSDKYSVLVQNVDRDPVTDLITHIELINVNMGQEITTKVSLHFEGTAPAVKDQGGTFTVSMHEVDIKCLPKNLIHGIDVDISSLTDFHEMIRVSDLKVPDTIEILNDPEELVASVSAPVVEEETDEASEGAAEGAEAPAEASKEESAEGGEE